MVGWSCLACRSSKKTCSRAVGKTGPQRPLGIPESPKVAIAAFSWPVWREPETQLSENLLTVIRGITADAMAKTTAKYQARGTQLPPWLWTPHLAGVGGAGPSQPVASSSEPDVVGPARRRHPRRIDSEEAGVSGEHGEAQETGTSNQKGKGRAT